MVEMKDDHELHDRSWFMRVLHHFFTKVADFVCRFCWPLIIISCCLSALGALKIPLTPITNDIQDFIDTDAPSRRELAIARNFFTDHIPNGIFAFITAKKDGENMLTLERMNETVHVLDFISRNFSLELPDEGKLPFEEFCRSMCQINEPIRYYFNGMAERVHLGAKSFLGVQKVDNGTDIPALDLSYPDTRAAGGVRFHMDAYFYGVQVEVEREGKRVVLNTTTAKVSEMMGTKHLMDNLRRVEMVVLIFKSELPLSIKKTDVDKFEHEITEYFAYKYKSDQISVNIVADSFITTEIVRAGLSLLPFLIIGFCIMCTFSAGTFLLSSLLLDQWNWDKMVLAWFACACPFVSCGTGLGVLLWSGVRFGSILCVTPFLVLAIGVDIAYLMVNAWQQASLHRKTNGLYEGTPEKELVFRIREVFTEAGPSITITSVTNIVAFIIDAFTSPPEVELFSYGNIACVFFTFVYTFTFYGAILVILGGRQVHAEIRKRDSKANVESSTAFGAALYGRVSDFSKNSMSLMHKCLDAFCHIIGNPVVAIIVLCGLVIYLILGTMAMMRIPVAIRPTKLFLSDSPFRKTFLLREKYMNPNYSPFWIYVSKPGDVWDPKQQSRIKDMVEAFEAHPSNVGKYSTKFWLREFEYFSEESPDFVFEGEYANKTAMEIARTTTDENTRYAQLRWFLTWPENAPWRGFMQFENAKIMANSTDDHDPKMTAFLFSTAYHGDQLKEWANRALLLKELRGIAQVYSDLDVSVYQEDGKFLDLFDVMAPQTIQSVIFCFLSMVAVTVFFIPHPLVLATCSFSILSTTIGVFGVMYLLGAELEPVFMSAMIMSIGFSVDIPAHIAYHYHQTKALSHNHIDRLRITISRVGFPIMQASLSTSLCVGSLLFVELHMARIFGSTMLLVVVIGTFHGLVIMPAVFTVWAQFPCSSAARSRIVPVPDRAPTSQTILSN